MLVVRTKPLTSKEHMGWQTQPKKQRVGQNRENGGRRLPSTLVLTQTRAKTRGWAFTWDWALTRYNMVYNLTTLPYSLPVCRLLSGEPAQFSCGPVSCPPRYLPGVGATCAVQWSAPWTTVNCAPSYIITVARSNNEEFVSRSSQSPLATRIYDIIVPEPAKYYTVTISATNVIGSTDCVTEFMSPKEQS